jgi:hypothetical protein
MRLAQWWMKWVWLASIDSFTATTLFSGWLRQSLVFFSYYKQPARRTETFDQRSLEYEYDDKERYGKLLQHQIRVMLLVSWWRWTRCYLTGARATHPAVITSQPARSAPPTMDVDDGTEANLSQDPPSLDDTKVDTVVPPILQRRMRPWRRSLSEPSFVR